MRELKKHSFLVLLFMSVVIVSIYGFICEAEGEDVTDRGQSVAVATAVHYWKDKLTRPEIPDIVPVSIVIDGKEAVPETAKQDGPDTVSEDQEKNTEITKDKAAGEEDPLKEDSKVSDNEAASGEKDLPDPGKDAEEAGKPTEENTGETGTEPGETEPQNPDFQLVDESYFDDALFIGDSRVVGFGLYSGLQNAAFYAHKGFQIYTFQTKQIVDTPFGKITVPEALVAQQGYFKKVYIMFGLNEMGWGTDEQFAQYYYNVIDTVKGTQPDAVIYVQSIMHVTKEVSDTSAVYSNDKIDERNEMIKRIAEDEHVYYLDLNEIFTNEENALPDEFSGDGVHLKAAYIELWKQYLMAHAIVNESSVSSDEIPAPATVSGN